MNRNTAHQINRFDSFKPSNPYALHGYASRSEYLESLCDEYPRALVYALADVLGPGEDFDGLVTSLEDEADFFDME